VYLIHYNEYHQRIHHFLLTYSKITLAIARANGQTRRGVEEGHSIEGQEKKKKGTLGYFWREDDLQNAKKNPISGRRCMVRDMWWYAVCKYCPPTLILRFWLSRRLFTPYTYICIILLYFIVTVLFRKNISFFCKRFASIVPGCRTHDAHCEVFNIDLT